MIWDSVSCDLWSLSALFYIGKSLKVTWTTLHCCYIKHLCVPDVKVCVFVCLHVPWGLWPNKFQFDPLPLWEHGGGVITQWGVCCATKWADTAEGKASLDLYIYAFVSLSLAVAKTVIYSTMISTVKLQGGVSKHVPSYKWEGPQFLQYLS